MWLTYLVIITSAARPDHSQQPDTPMNVHSHDVKPCQSSAVKMTEPSFTLSMSSQSFSWWSATTAVSYSSQRWQTAGRQNLWDSNKVWPTQHARSTNRDHLGKHQESHCSASLTPPAARHCLRQCFNHRQMSNGLPQERRMSPWGQWMLSVASVSSFNNENQH